MHNTKRLYKTLIEQLTGKRLNIYISLCMPVNMLKKSYLYFTTDVFIARCKENLSTSFINL